jgi:opacity protein-like surface antigen
MDASNFHGIVMNLQQPTPRRSRVFAIAFLALSTMSWSMAYSETYIGGQIGTTIAGNKLRSIELTDFSPAGSKSDQSLAPAPLIGFKLGYYFPRAKWFGLETEAYHLTPHIKQQSTTVSIPAGAVLRDFGPVAGGTATAVTSGDHFRVITWVPVNFMFRYYKTRLQPYVGFGPGVFFGKITTTDPQFAESNGSTRLGLNAKAGVEYFMTRHFTAFVEGKYNYTKFEFNRTNDLSFKTTYNPLFVAFGLSYHF